MQPLYAALEVAVVGTFALAAWSALRRGRLPLLELLSAAAFGLLLEEGDQLIFQGYHYSPDWLLVVGHSPVAIGLTWALILAGAMRLTDALGVRRRYGPFVDSVLAVSLDLAFDAIAIRLGLWTWRGMTLSDGWFGVPAGNFYTWLWVTLAFSFVTRWLRDAAVERPSREWLQLLVPVPAYAILLAGLLPFIALKPHFYPEPGDGLWLFLLVFAIFLALAGWGVFGPDRGRTHGGARAILDLPFAFAVRVAIHGVFLGAFLVLGLAPKLPVLLVVALVLLAAEVPLAWLVQRRLDAARTVAMASPAAATSRTAETAGA